jgi:hypothetical protein
MSNITVKLVNAYFNTAFVKYILKKNGRNPEMAWKDLKFAYTDKKFGQSSYWAYGIMFAIPISACFALELLYISYVHSLSAEVFIGVFFSYAAIIFLLNYFLLMRHNKYIKYFRQFERQPHEWKVKWAWISAGVILFPFLVLAGSFIAMLPK